MNLHQLDKKATDDVFRLMGRRVRYQFKDGTSKTCRAVILRGATYDPVIFQSHVLDDEVQIVVVPGLLHVLEESDLVDRLDGVLLVGISRQDDPRDIGFDLPHLRQERDPVHLGHQIIGDDETHIVVTDELQSLRRRQKGVDDVVRLERQKGIETGEDHLFVIDDDYGCLQVGGHGSLRRRS